MRTKEQIQKRIANLLEKARPKNKHAQALGRLGGRANKGIPKPKSAENGKLGGRPRKS